MKLNDVFDLFLLVPAHIKYLVKNTEALCATGVMINLIVDGLEYISNHTSSSFLGASSLLHSSRSQTNVSGDEYERRLSELTENFSKAKTAFDYSIGEHVLY